MKWRSNLNLTTALLVAATLGWTVSATAQVPPTPTLSTPFDHSINLPPDVEAALVYPNSSQRFFEAGIAQFEAEIQRLDDEQPDPVLVVQPEATEPFEDK